MSNKGYYVFGIEKTSNCINKDGGMRKWVTVIAMVAAAVVVWMACMGVGVADDDGLVAEWHFDEGSGSVLVDSSGNGNDGVINGATWVGGVSGSALSFDGVDDYVEVPHDSSLDFGYGDLSISSWMHPFLQIERWSCKQQQLPSSPPACLRSAPRSGAASPPHPAHQGPFPPTTGTAWFLFLHAPPSPWRTFLAAGCERRRDCRGCGCFV